MSIQAPARSSRPTAHAATSPSSSPPPAASRQTGTSTAMRTSKKTASTFSTAHTGAVAATDTATAAAAAASVVSKAASPPPPPPLRIEVTPTVAEYINYDVDTNYVMPVEVRNRTEELLTFRFVAPVRHPSIFRLLNPAAVRVAPGLAHTIEVEFSTHLPEDYSDVLTVLSSNGGRVEVPLTACRVPQLELPPEVDFGKLEQTQGNVSRTFPVINRGRRDASVSFEVASTAADAVDEDTDNKKERRDFGPPRGIALVSGAAIAAAQSRTNVTIELKALSPGVYVWHLIVFVDGKRLPEPVTVCAEVPDCRSRLMDPRTQKEVVSLEFPETYAGNTKTRQLEVVNGGSQAISFAIQPAHSLPDGSGAVPFHFVPSEGRLPPQGRQTVIAQFVPPLQVRRTGWSNTNAGVSAVATVLPGGGTEMEDNAASAAANTALTRQSTAAAAAVTTPATEETRYEALFSLLFVETEQTQSFRLVGTSCETLVQLSVSHINFGTCAMHAVRRAMLTITNALVQLPMKYTLQPPSHFLVTPARGVVPAGSSVEVQVEFRPRRLGTYDEVMILTASDTVTRTVTLRGHSVFRQATEAAENLSGVAGTTRPRPRSQQQTPASFSSSRKRALEKTAVPAAVDLGMIPAEGLRPPSLPKQVPAAVLRAEDAGTRIGVGAGAAGHAHGGQTSSHVAPRIFDTRSLVRRRYHTSPATAHERYDCKRELTPMEVLNVVLPVKALDFGRVTVHADVVDSLYVYNGTQACILAAVPVEADGLVTIDPPSQVIPPQRMAQFDVHFSSPTVQAFQQVMRVAVNQQHFMRYNVHAEVVPVEVTLSQKEVRMALLGQAEEPVCTAPLTLGNNGNSVATYRWHLPPSCEFAVEPLVAALEPGEQHSTTLFFRPSVGTTHATCEARLEVDGAVEEKVLALVGTVAPAKCSWRPPANMTAQESAPSVSKDAAEVLNLGRIAAGVPATDTLSLLNKGKTNAYFSIGPLPPWITITPSHGRVCTGEAEDLTVVVRHAVAGPVSQTVECIVVGMRRPLTVRVEATVVAPPLTVLSSSKDQGEVILRFGAVYVGCPQSRSVVLHNSGDVAAAVRVNLEACAQYSLASTVLNAVIEDRDDHDDSQARSAPGNGNNEGSASDAVSRMRSRIGMRARSTRAFSSSLGGINSSSASFLLGYHGGVRSVACAATVVVPPHAKFPLCVSYNPVKPTPSYRCAVRWHQIGADEVHPLPPFMLEATARQSPVVLTATSLNFPVVMVGQRPPPRVIHVRRTGSGIEEVSRRATGDSDVVTPGRGPPSRQQPVTWWLQSSSEEGGSASDILVEPNRGTLNALGEEQAITITYLAANAGSLRSSLQLRASVGTQPPDAGTAPCRVCDVTAAANHPRVRCSASTVVFPSVPLGVAVQATVWLFNDGYDTVHVSYAGSCAPPLVVAFPEGIVMSRAPRNRLPVTLTFCSPVAISVRSSIRLATDVGGGAAGGIDVEICGSAINSILTTTPFISYVSDAPPIEASANTPYVWEDAAADRADETRGESDSPSGTAIAATAAGRTRLVVTLPELHQGSSSNSSLRRSTPHDFVDVVESTIDWQAEKDWMTTWWSSYMSRTPVRDVIEALQISRGGLIADMIEQLTGKRPRRSDAEGSEAPEKSSRRGNNKSNNSKTHPSVRFAARAASTTSNAAAPLDSSAASPAPPVAKELRTLDTLITYLRSCGACLSGVELPYLLPLDAFLEYVSERASAMVGERGSSGGGGNANYGETSRVSSPLPPQQPAPSSPLTPQHAEVESDESVWAATFHRRAVPSWLTVVRECLRLFYVSQVRGNSNSSSVTAALLPPALRERWGSGALRRTLSRSNVYSEEESLLLRWVELVSAAFLQADKTSLHTRLGLIETAGATASAVAPQRLEDLRDGRHLLAVVLMYVPAFAREVAEAVSSSESLMSSHNPSAQMLTSMLGADGAGAVSVMPVQTILLHVLEKLGLPGLPTPLSLASASPTRLLLLLTHLYTYLPKFIAKTMPVHFHGRALTTLRETITIDNTSSELREYRVLMLPETAPFLHTSETVTVEPRGSTVLTLSVFPRTQRALEGHCALIETSALVLPSDWVPLVFHLVAAPTMEPLKTVQISASLYDVLQTELAIDNPFPVDCVVSLRVSQSRLPSTGGGETADGEKAVSMPWLSAREDEEEGNAHWRAAHDAPFSVNTDVLSLRRGQTTRLPFTFLPLSRGTFRLLVTFREDMEGEFTYAVEATSGWPRVADGGVELRVEQGEKCNAALLVRNTNPALERCLKAYEDRAHRTRRTDLMQLLCGARYSVYFVNDQMEGPNPFFKALGSIYVAPLAPSTAGQLPFTFQPQGVGVYRTNVLLVSSVDVRLLTLSGECVPEGDRRELHFACPARQSIVQQITLCNHSAEDWLFTATLDGSPHFTGPRDVRVPAGRSKEYTLKYSPAWITTEPESAAFVLSNGTTGQRHTYTLTGNAAPPLSEGIVTVDCRAREPTSVDVAVPNICSQDTTYFVKIDLSYCEGETASLVIPRAGTRRYVMKVHPTIGGDFTGRVTFTAPNGRYVWYAVQLHVDPPEKEGVVELQTDVRTSLAAAVTVSNPHDIPLLFKVQRYGLGLCGPNTLALGPRATATYDLLFVPTHAGEFAGRLSLASAVVGEFWYELRMTVVEAAPEPLAFSDTPLGQRQVMQVHLPNRTNTNCVLTVESTQPACFTVQPARVVLPASTNTVVDVLFIPHNVGAEQRGIVTLRHAELGCWRYACTGTGRAPSPAESVSCSSALGTTTTLTLPFTNDLWKDTPIDVRLRDSGSASQSTGAVAFAIRSAPNASVAAGASSAILVAFTPTLVQRYDAVVEVRPKLGTTDPTCDVMWTYPIQGNCEFRQAQPPLRLRCAARTHLANTFYLHAPGLTPELAEDVALTFDVDANQAYRETAASSVTCALTTPSPYPDGFEAQVKFLPLRPFIGSGWIVVRGAKGGVWRYRVQFEATPASAPDDTIVLRSEYKGVTTAAFDMYNVFPYRSPFFAYFTADSSKDFSVSPSHGVLLPFVQGQRGAAPTATSVHITVRPSSRVPQVEGTLLVDTDDMQWIFHVVSRFGRQARVP